MSLHELFGKIGNERGKTAEDLVENAFEEDHDDLPDWFKGYKRATKEEYCKSIDGWVYTDVGKIKLQIKSSWRNANKFSRTHKDTAVLVVKLGQKPVTIRQNLTSAVEPLRDKYLSKRKN